MKRKMSNASFNEIQPHSNVAKPEQLELQSLFKRAEQKGSGITFYDFVQILRSKRGNIQISTLLVSKERISC